MLVVMDGWMVDEDEDEVRMEQRIMMFHIMLNQRTS